MIDGADPESRDASLHVDEWEGQLMLYDRDQVLAHWNDESVESMYDKNLLAAEIEIIRRRIPAGAKILDAGCGEGEGTLVYSSISGTVVHAVDFSETRLRKARQRLIFRPNVDLRHVDLVGKHDLDRDYDVVVSQRFLINLLSWALQQRVLLDLMALLKPGGRLLLLEGSKQGSEQLNEFRAALELAPIPVQWHNLFLDDVAVCKHMRDHGYELVDEDGLGAYFLLTRGVRPALDTVLSWDTDFNRLAAGWRTAELLALGARFSRLKLWVFRKLGPAATDEVEVAPSIEASSAPG